MKQDLERILKPLSADEKLDVIEYLTASLRESDVPLTEAQRKIVREREVIYKTGNTELHSWEDVKKSIRSDQ
ncbi:MAG: addiction module protein [Balneolaceae bacterium]|nr:addiction module protein [Balneolaceae bacterium]